MQATTYTSYVGRRSIGSQKSFHNSKGMTQMPQRKGSHCIGISKKVSNSAMELVLSPEKPHSTFAQAAAVSVPAPCLDQAAGGGACEELSKSAGYVQEESGAQGNASSKLVGEQKVRNAVEMAVQGEKETKADPEEDFTQIEEEEKAVANGPRKPLEGGVAASKGCVFLRASGGRQPLGRPQIAKSVTCATIDMDKEKDVPTYNGNPTETLKASKSPDPFENSHAQTETELGDLIFSTTNADSPLRGLQMSGNRSPAALKAHKHFIISLFESMAFMREMKPIEDAEVVMQRVFLTPPKTVSCTCA
jgi:hypothetical protein